MMSNSESKKWFHRPFLFLKYVSILFIQKSVAVFVTIGLKLIVFAALRLS